MFITRLVHHKFLVVPQKESLNSCEERLRQYPQPFLAPNKTIHLKLFEGMVCPDFEDALVFLAPQKVTPAKWNDEACASCDAVDACFVIVILLALLRILFVYCLEKVSTERVALNLAVHPH